jgi:hypothetical protein
MQIVPLAAERRQKNHQTLIAAAALRLTLFFPLFPWAHAQD